MNSGSNEVWTYTIQPGTGRLSLSARDEVRARLAPQGVAFTAGSSPVTYTPKFAFVTGNTNYTVDASSGVLTPIPSTTTIGGRFVAVDPTNRFAYVASGGNDVLGYTIDSTTGALTPITGSPFAAGRGTQSVAVDPSGRFAHVTNFLDNSVSGYIIDSTTGALAPVSGSPFTAGFPASVAVDPTGRFAYVTNLAKGSVFGYTISPSTGALTVIPGSPFAAGAPPCSELLPSGCDHFSSVGVDPTGRFAYVANRGANAVSGYIIDATTGALKPITGSPFATGTTATSVAVDPSGEFAYVGVSGYTINANTGALTLVTGSPFASVVGESNMVDPSGKFVYTVDYWDGSPMMGDVYGNTIDAATGALTPIPGSPFTPVPPGSCSGACFFSTSMAVSGEIH